MVGGGRFWRFRERLFDFVVVVVFRSSGMSLSVVLSIPVCWTPGAMWFAFAMTSASVMVPWRS